QMLLGALAIAAAARLLEDPRAPRRMAAYAAALAALLYTHYLPAAALMGSVGAVLLWRLIRQRRPMLLLPLLVPPVLVALVSTPWLAHLARSVGRLAHTVPYALTASPLFDRLVQVAYVLVAFTDGEMIPTWALPLAALATVAAAILAV